MERMERLRVMYSMRVRGKEGRGGGGRRDGVEKYLNIITVT